MPRFLSGILAFLMFQTSVFGFAPQKAEPASHIYFENVYAGEWMIGFRYGKGENDLPEGEYIADFECATESPEVVWSNGTDYLIRDDRYYRYSPVTKEKTVVFGLDVGVHNVKALTVQTECTEEGGYLFASRRYIVVTEIESGKESVFDMETECYITAQIYSGISAVSTDRAKDAEFIYATHRKLYEYEDGFSCGECFYQKCHL